MTEEIIVNGFDVSECYADNKMMKDGLYCFWEGGNCENNEYCYYKECKRLEQKNKELKEKYSHVLELAKLNADSNEYCLRKLEKKYKRLRSALEEIREILNKNCGVISNAKAVGIINEVLNIKDLGFWDKDGEYKEDFQVVDEREFCENKTTSNDV